MQAESGQIQVDNVLCILRLQAEVCQAEVGSVLRILWAQAEAGQAEVGNVLHIQAEVGNVLYVLFIILLQAEVNFCVKCPPSDDFFLFSIPKYCFLPYTYHINKNNLI